MYFPTEDTLNSRSLYVGNLDPSVSEELLMALFAHMGSCENCKIMQDPSGDLYALIEFSDHQAAANALLAMHKCLFMGKEIKINWANVPSYPKNKVKKKYYNIFVGDIAPEIDQNILRAAFSPYGEIAEIKIVKYPDSNRSKGYCFIGFTNRNDAETAITSMNGKWLGTRKIRTNWAVRKTVANKPTNFTPNQDRNYSQYNEQTSIFKPDYNDVWNRTTSTNSTVYFGGCPDVNETLIQSIFIPFGHIDDIRVFKEKGYAFVRFSSKESACQAICHIHGVEINGSSSRCNWGREEPVNIHHYNNNPYDSYSQNLYEPSFDNNYIGDGEGFDHHYDDSFPQQYYNPHQWTNNNTDPHFDNTQPTLMWNQHSQSTNNNDDWTANNNNNNYFDSNFHQYHHPQHSQLYSSNSGWESSQH